MAAPAMAAAQHIVLPVPKSPNAPGPFAFADAGRVQDILERAGFSGVEIADHRSTLTVGGRGPLDRAVEFLMQIGPLGAALREATPELGATVAAAVRDALIPYRTPEGLRMASAAWIVTAARS
jgi:hypothetical protein